MPIYAYKCETCGHAKDVLRKLSDPALTQCPQCGAETFVKQVTAAGFQLKGSGWYVTDFRGGNSGAPAAAGSDKDGPAPAAASAPAVADAASAKPASTEAVKPAASAAPATSAATTATPSKSA
ncbi:MAG: FmdB family zinc ribbon protein [Pseudomonadota bacterium]